METGKANLYKFLYKSALNADQMRKLDEMILSKIRDKSESNLSKIRDKFESNLSKRHIKSKTKVYQR